MRKELTVILLFFVTYMKAQVCFNPSISNTIKPYPWAICSADFNGDGFIDLASSSDVNDTISVFMGTGSGTFGSIQTYTTGFTQRGLITADFNMDGILDLAADNGAGGGHLTILLGNGNGTFGSATTFTFNGSNSEDLVSGDFNEDNFTDVVLTNHGGGGITLMLR